VLAGVALLRPDPLRLFSDRAELPDIRDGQPGER